MSSPTIRVESLASMRAASVEAAPVRAVVANTSRPARRSVAGARSPARVGHRLRPSTRSVFASSRAPMCPTSGHRKHRRVGGPAPSAITDGLPTGRPPPRPGTGRSSTRRQRRMLNPSRSFRSGCARNLHCRNRHNEARRDHRLPRALHTARRRWAATGTRSRGNRRRPDRARNKGTVRSPTTRSASRWRARSCDCKRERVRSHDLLRGRARWPPLATSNLTTGPSNCNELSAGCRPYRKLRAVCQLPHHPAAHRRSVVSCVAAWSSWFGAATSTDPSAGVAAADGRPLWYRCTRRMPSSTCRHIHVSATSTTTSTPPDALLGADTTRSCNS